MYIPNVGCIVSETQAKFYYWLIFGEINTKFYCKWHFQFFNKYIMIHDREHTYCM